MYDWQTAFLRTSLQTLAVIRSAVMGQRMMGHSAKAACGDSMVNMGSDESVLILIQHCQDMKQQETRLRLITFLLLLSCMALVLFMTGANLWQHKNSGSRQQEVSYKTFSLCAKCSLSCRGLGCF